MATASGQPDSALVAGPILRALRSRPWDFSFYQAVRLLHRLAGSGGSIGSFTPPGTEVLRLGAHVSLSFPASEIQRLELREDAPHRMTVNFFGLTGPLGVLPTHYTEALLQRLQVRDGTMRDFYDAFNHRAISLLYRAWEKYRYPVTYERGGPDRFSRYMLAVVGLGFPALQDRQAIPDQALIFYSGLLAQFPRSAASMRLMLAHYFSVPCQIEEFAGCWRPLEPDSQTCLQDTRTPCEQLGIGMVLGDEVWDQQSVVRIRLGPLSLDQYSEFLPTGNAWRPLEALVRFYCGCDLDAELQLVLKREEAPRFALGVEGAPPAQLGWTSWVATRTPGRDPDDTIVRLLQN
jgi:type VI secretion system protein ImpH